MTTLVTTHESLIVDDLKESEDSITNYQLKVANQTIRNIKEGTNGPTDQTKIWAPLHTKQFHIPTEIEKLLLGKAFLTTPKNQSSLWKIGEKFLLYQNSKLPRHYYPRPPVWDKKWKKYLFHLQ